DKEGGARGGKGRGQVDDAGIDHPNARIKEKPAGCHGCVPDAQDLREGGAGGDVNDPAVEENGLGAQVRARSDFDGSGIDVGAAGGGVPVGVGVGELEGAGAGLGEGAGLVDHAVDLQGEAGIDLNNVRQLA